MRERTASTGALRGRRIALTRPDAGALGALLAEIGAVVVHVPLIEFGPPADGGAALARALADLSAYDWLVVTSATGARAVASALGDGAPGVRLAAVGPASAAVLAAAAGRPVDLVPPVPRGTGLVAAFPPGPGRVLLAQANRATDDVATGLRAAGHDVAAVTAYATAPRRPDFDEIVALSDVDAVVFASDSAVEAWVAADLPVPAVVAIGPTTAAGAAAAGLAPAAVAATPDPAGIVAALVAALNG